MKNVCEGIGGRIKAIPEDFVVEEIPKEKEREDEDQLIFWVEKRNWDTHDVIRILSRKLRVSRKRFGYAGTKDKFAIARQRFSVWDPTGELEEKLKTVKLPDIKIYGFSRGYRLNLGDLEGNKFLITIRGIELEESEIKERLQKIFTVLKNGIPNYFGEQRFGGIRAVTHLVGYEMLRGNFEEATKIYISKIFEEEAEDIKKIREFVAKNWGDRKAYLKALNMFSKRFRYERAMLQYLYVYPRDFVGALRRIPKKVRKLFINAVQSYIFNEVLKKLVKKHGIEKLKGKTIKLVGYDTVFENKEEDRETLKLLKTLSLSREDFLMPSMPEMKTTGGERKAIIEVKDIKLLSIKEDELEKGKNAVKISFSLPPGSYATIVLAYIMGGCKDEKIQYPKLGK